MAGPARVNDLDSAVNVAHANRLKNQMYRGQQFSLFGRAKLSLSTGIVENSYIFLEGLGDIWSAKYVVWNVEHVFQGGEGYTEVDVGSDASLHGSEADRKAALAEAGIVDKPAEDEQVEYFNKGVDPITIPTSAIPGIDPSLLPSSTDVGNASAG